MALACTSNIDDTLRRQLAEYANETKEANLPSELVNHLKQREAELINEFADLSLSEARKRSAELNGLLADARSSPADALRGTYHILITTDTALGQRAGFALKGLLESVGAVVLDVFTPQNLRTDTTANFQQGVRKLIAWCAETLEGYRQSYTVCFNLVGGFKTLQGYMTVLGMFYANEILYVFETGDQTIRIPRLPIVLDDAVIRKHAASLALLCAYDEPLPRRCLPDPQLPDVFIEPINGDHVTASAWGFLVWNQRKDELLAETLLSLPRLRYSDKFKRRFDKSDNPARVAVQETLAKVSFLLCAHDGDLSALKRDGGLQYEGYVNRRTHDDQPIGHFRINQSDRVNCVYQNGELILCEFGPHDIERNPCAGE